MLMVPSFYIDSVLTLPINVYGSKIDLLDHTIVIFIKIGIARS